MSKVITGFAFEEVIAPIDGHVPDCVGLWKPVHQIAWFGKYMNLLRAQQDEFPVWVHHGIRFDAYWVTSRAHRGICCPVCASDRDVCMHRLYPLIEGQCCHKEQQV